AHASVSRAARAVAIGVRCSAVSSSIFARPVLRSSLSCFEAASKALKMTEAGVSLGSFCGIEPITQRLGACFEVCQRLSTNYNRRNAFQVVMNLAEMIQRVVEVKTQEGVSHRSLLPVGHEEVHRDQMRDEKLAFFVSHCEIIRAAIFEIAKTGNAHAVAVNGCPGHYRHLWSPLAIGGRADTDLPNEHAEKQSRKNQGHSRSAR